MSGWYVGITVVALIGIATYLKWGSSKLARNARIWLDRSKPAFSGRTALSTLVLFELVCILATAPVYWLEGKVALREYLLFAFPAAAGLTAGWGLLAVNRPLEDRNVSAYLGSVFFLLLGYVAAIWNTHHLALVFGAVIWSCVLAALWGLYWRIQEDPGNQTESILQRVPIAIMGGVFGLLVGLGHMVVVVSTTTTREEHTSGPCCPKCNGGDQANQQREPD